MREREERRKRERQRERERERERERRDVLTCGPHHHVASMSAKPPSKTAKWSNVHCR
jgi:hypothetical protein